MEGSTCRLIIINMFLIKKACINQSSKKLAISPVQSGSSFRAKIRQLYLFPFWAEEKSDPTPICNFLHSFRLWMECSLHFLECLLVFCLRLANRGGLWDRFAILIQYGLLILYGSAWGEYRGQRVLQNNTYSVVEQ